MSWAGSLGVDDLDRKRGPKRDGDVGIEVTMEIRSQRGSTKVSTSDWGGGQRNTLGGFGS